MSAPVLDRRSEPGRIEVLVRPMQLRPTDIFTDESGEWEVLSRPAMRSNGKIVWAKVRQPDDDASLKTRSWRTQDLITVMRSVDIY